MRPTPNLNVLTSTVLTSTVLTSTVLTNTVLTSTRDSRRNLATAVTVALCVVFIDQLSKRWAVDRLTVGSCRADECIDVIWSLRFRLHFNRGASFSTGTSVGPLFGVIAIVMSVVLLVMASKATRRWMPVLLGLIVGGAVGNLLDRLFRADDGPLSGGVVDFIDFQFWPIFNVADAAIVVGVVLIVVLQAALPETQDAGPDTEKPARDGAGPVDAHEAAS